MTVRYGFDLDMAAVRLMRRDGGQWLEEAVEKIDGPDIEDRLQVMVDRIEGNGPVELFLPRDQILYTDVEISSEDDALDEIDRAMDGRTPYALDELEIDWEMTAPGTARVAAIARETLDEAFAFAEARGMRVAGYSSLATPEEFPRLPDFGGNLFDEDETGAEEGEAEEAPDEETVAAVTAEGDEEELSDETVAEDTPETVEAAPAEVPDDDENGDEDEDDDGTAAAVQFTSAREHSRPPMRPAASLSPSVAAGSDQPVVRVDDSTPVMRVRSRDVAPLNPGAPLAAKPGAPRVRTDIAAASVSVQAASLTPPVASLKVRRSSSAPLRTLLVFAVALVLTIGIAFVVWRILPLGPTNSAVQPAAQAPETEIVRADPAPAPAPAPVVTPSPEPEAAAPVEAAAPLPDLPRPEALSETAELVPPDMGAAPAIAPLAPLPTTGDAPDLMAALRAGEGLPEYDPETPLAAPPEGLTQILTEAPFPGPVSDDDVAETSEEIYIASIESPALASDAIALPGSQAFMADGLPAVGAAPAPAVAPEAEAPAAVAALEPAEESPAPALPEPAPEVSAPSATDEAARLALEDTPEAESGLPRPTAFAEALSDRAPRARPTAFVEVIERQIFNGLTRDQLATRRPPARPESAQIAATEAAEPAPASELAVETSLAPRERPAGFDRLVAAALVQSEADRLTASLDYETPDTSGAIEAALEADSEPEPRPQDTPRLAIPSNASVARQATIEDAISLNKVNLVGVYGTPADRRALVRLPSGRYVKLKVGDRIDGGTVAQIGDDELLYRKGNRTVSLALPKG